jgi:hypothetical protein
MSDLPTPGPTPTPQPPAQMISPAKKTEIQAALQTRIKSPCPRCGGASGALADGYVYHVLQNGDPNRGFQEGPVLVCAVIICNTCGATSEHSVPHLGVQPYP